MFCADGQMDRETDMTKLIVTFCNFANSLINTSLYFFYNDMLLCSYD